MPLINMGHPVFVCFPNREHGIKKLIAENPEFLEVCEDYKTILDEMAAGLLPEENTSQPVLSELRRLKSELEVDIQYWLNHTP